LDARFAGQQLLYRRRLARLDVCSVMIVTELSASSID